MLLNLSNHPYSKWDEAQKQAVMQLYGEIVDMPFPNIDPDGNELYIESLAEVYKVEIMAMPEIKAVHIMGELTFTFALVNKLIDVGLKCVASTTERVSTEHNGVKTSIFKFKKFREYARQ